MNNIDTVRSQGSLAHKIFGAMLCDECREPSDILYDSGLEESYCYECAKQYNLVDENDR